MKQNKLFLKSLFLLTNLQIVIINSAYADEKKSISKKELSSLTEITITADPFNHSLLEHGSPASIVTKDEITKNAQATIAETIAKEPGVSTSYFGPAASRPIIRGNAGQRIRVLKNGTGTLDISNTSEDHAVSTSPLSAESIEILRGPETLLFGSSAIGGVVNITDNSIPENAIGKPFSSEFDLRQGSADNELTGAVKLEGEKEEFNWHFDYFQQNTDDIDIPGFAESDVLRATEEEAGESQEEEAASGKLLNSFSGTEGFTIGGSKILENGFIGASLNFWDSKYGVPGHAQHEEEDELDEDQHEAEEVKHEEEGVAIDAKQIRADIKGALNPSSDLIETLKFKLAVSNYKHDEIEEGNVGTRFENEALETRLDLVHREFGKLRGALGVQLQASDFSALGEEAFLPQTDTTSPAIFVFEEYLLNDYLKLQAGSRFEHVSYDASGFSSDSFNPLSASTGLVWNPNAKNDYSVGLSFAYTERAPASTELYADGAHVARQIFEIGDQELELERSSGFDLSLRKNTGLLTGAINLFVQDYADYINLEATGEEKENFPVFQYESINALFWGFEIESTLHLHELFNLWIHDIDLNAQFDFLRAKNRSQDEDLPRMPPLRTIVSLDYEYKNLFGASIEGVFVEEQERIAEFELPTDSYQLLNASLHLNLPVYQKNEVTFYINGTNLTDQEARVHSSFIKDLAPLRGRSVLMGIRGVF